MHRWPSRRPPSSNRVPRGLKRPDDQVGDQLGDRPGPLPRTPRREQPAAGASLQQSPPPFLVPLERRHAWWSTLVIVGVLAFLALFLFYLYSLWLPQGAPALIVYVTVLAATVLTVLLFAGSLLGFVLPRLLGLRGPPSPRRAGKD